MPWFDNTDAFNQASGWPREWMTWGQDRMRRGLYDSDRYRTNADWIQQQLQDYYWNQMNEGYASPEEIAARGQQATPWINSAIDQMGQNAAGVNTAFQNRQSVDDVFNPIYGRANDWAADISRTGDATQGEIDALSRTLGGRNEGVNREIQGGIRDTFGRVDSGINDTFGGLRRGNAQLGSDLLSATNQAYGGLRGASDSTFSGLRDSSDQTYRGLQDRTGTTFNTLTGQLGGTESEIQREIEQLRPNSELSQARAARSYAPQVAATNQRLRSMGIGPNDLQAMSALADVEARRGAAMDDAAIEQNTGIADRLNQMRTWGYNQRAGLGLGELDRMTDLGLGQQAGRERLGIQGLLNSQGLTEREQGIGRDIATDAFGREMQLGIGQNDRSNQSALAALGLSNAERVRALMNQQGIDTGRTNATIGNLNDSFNRTLDWRTGLNNTDMQRYSAGLNDIDMQRGMADWNNSNAMRDVGLRNTQYGFGNEWTQNNYGRRDAGAANMGNLMAGQYNQAQQGNQNAMAWGNSAMNAADTARGYDASRGNLGFRLIGGMAPQIGSLIGMIPGVGSFLGPAVSGGLSAMYGQQGSATQPQRQSQSGQSGGSGGRTSGAGYVIPSYSNSAAYPQMQQWNNFGQNMFGNLRIPTGGR